MSELEYKELDNDVELCTEQEMSLFDTKDEMVFAIEYMKHSIESGKIGAGMAYDSFIKECAI